MQALILFFVELCLLRRAPQDLPASETLLGLALAANLVAGVLVGATAGLSLASNLAQGIAEIALTLGALQVALRLTGHPGRFMQAATAILGTGALVAVAAVIPMAMNATGSDETDAATLGAILLLALIVWSIVIAGHILRHTFSISLGQGAAISFAFELFSISLLGALFGSA